MSDAERVKHYMDKLEHPLKAEINAVRAIIANANPKLKERIKWNARSFYYKKDMLAFHPRNQRAVQLIFVFHNGDMIFDADGLLEGEYKDRRIACFYNMDDVQHKKAALENVVNQWVQLIEAAG